MISNLITPTTEEYWLKNAHIPSCLLSDYPQQPSDFTLVDVKIAQGKIEQIIPSKGEIDEITSIDLGKKIVFPCFIDVHTHLDKGHIWERSPNSNGTFAEALKIAMEDGQKNWRSEDVYQRMEFALKCSYAHGTQAIRTHIDSFGVQAEISLGVWKELQKKWQDKIIFQAVSLVSLDYFQTAEGIILADKIAELGGILGGVAYINPDLEAQLDIVFKLATERGLNLDFHVDENGDPDSICLQKIAQAALKHQFTGNIICGHCCSLAVQSPTVVKETLDLVKQAGIGIVSLPMCNLYLQDRQGGKTPYWRGVTLVHEIKQKDIPIAFASDNCRDPFYAFGDHDVLEVFTQAVRIAHLDHPYSNWCQSVTKTPAKLMGLDNLGQIKVGNKADLIIFSGRYYSELLSRPQADRIVLREGRSIDTTLPDYSELDNPQ